MSLGYPPPPSHYVALLLSQLAQCWNDSGWCHKWLEPMNVVSLFRGKDYGSVSQVLCRCRLESSGRNCVRAELEGGRRGTVILQPSDIPSSPGLDWMSVEWDQ